MADDAKKEDDVTEKAPEESPEVAPEDAQAAEVVDDASEDESVEVPDKFKDLVETIEQLPVLELAELVKVLEKKFGVSAAVAAAPVAAGGGEEAAEKDSFDVELAEAGSSKIQVIKAVKEITGKGLKDAKDIVDSAPVLIAEGANETEANDLKGKLEEAGATVNLK